MRWNRLSAAIVWFALASANAAMPSTQPSTSPDTQPASLSIPFETYDGYFVSNAFENFAPDSFVVLQSQSEFEKVFGIAMVMHDTSHRLPTNAFDTNLVVATVKRGNSIWETTVKNVSDQNGMVVVRYTTSEIKKDSGQFVSPMIISIPKGDYSAVQFEENGTAIRRITLNDNPVRHVPTTQEAKADIERQIAAKLGRPLTEAETEMIDVTQSGSKINIMLHQPLTGRLMQAMHTAHASAASAPTTPPAGAH